MNLIVGVGDMKVSNDPNTVLVTYSLGSCIGVGVYDPVAKVAGLLHYMLPESSLDAVKARKNPFMFGDTGIPVLFKETYRLGAKKNSHKSRVKLEPGRFSGGDVGPAADARLVSGNIWAIPNVGSAYAV